MKASEMPESDMRNLRKAIYYCVLGLACCPKGSWWEAFFGFPLTLFVPLYIGVTVSAWDDRREKRKQLQKDP